MGLDNGIVLRIFDSEANSRRTKRLCKKAKYFLPEDEEYPTPRYYPTKEHGKVDANKALDIEVAYWRKFWGLRGMFLKALPALDEYGEEILDNGYRFLVDSYLLEDLLIIARQFLDEEYFEENGEQQIWTYDEYLDVMKHQIEQLEKLQSFFKWAKRHGYKPFVDYTAYFYDSY